MSLLLEFSHQYNFWRLGRVLERLRRTPSIVAIISEMDPESRQIGSAFEDLIHLLLHRKLTSLDVAISHPFLEDAADFEDFPASLNPPEGTQSGTDMNQFAYSTDSSYETQIEPPPPVPTFRPGVPIAWNDRFQKILSDIQNARNDAESEV